MRSSGRSRKVYVVTAPASIRGIYDTWDACRAAVSGIAGARYQGVSSREVAEAMLSGEGLQLEPGLYAFVDGNAMGGIGVVLVEQRDAEPAATREIATTVYDVFARPASPVSTPAPRSRRRPTRSRTSSRSSVPSMPRSGRSRGARP